MTKKKNHPRAIARKTRAPIMSTDNERFMAFTGLVKWTQGVVLQSKRVVTAEDDLNNFTTEHMKSLYNLHCEDHYFVIAANKLIEHRGWVEELGLCGSVDFSEIDAFPRQIIKDLRNMREHVVEYFKGDGKAKERWIFETPIYSADASSRINNLIGGRLDYVEFSIAAERLLSRLTKEPIPFPPPSEGVAD